MYGSLGNDALRATKEQTEILKDIVTNVSNAHSLAYKKSDTNFAQTLNGESIKFQNTDFAQGSLRKTSDSLDFAIEGKGFFEIELPNGQRAYTRVGRFKLSAEGELVTAEGYRVLPQVEQTSGEGKSIIIAPDNLGASKLDLNLKVSSPKLVIPGDYTTVVESDGTIYGIPDTNVGTGEKVKLGKVSVVLFNNPDGLNSISKGYYTQTNESGVPQEVKVGMNESTQVRQGYIEGANVDIAATFMQLAQIRNLLSAQFKVIKSIDKIYENINYTVSRSI